MTSTPTDVAEPAASQSAPPDPSSTSGASDISPDRPVHAMRMVGILVVVTLALIALYLACVNGTWCPVSVQTVLKHEGFLTAMVAAIYLVTLLIARVLLIARPYRKSLEARLAVVRERANARPPSSRPELQMTVSRLLDSAADKLQDSDRVLWSWGDQTGAFDLISQAESLLAGRLTAAEARLRLDLLLPEMDRYGTIAPHAADAKRRLEASLMEADRRCNPIDAIEALHGKTNGSSGTQLADDIKTVHSNALQLLHRLELDEFARILKWHRKVLWLTVVGLGLAVLLATFLHNAALLLVGAAGAYFARLARIIKRADTQPEDTSSYWTNLLLGPVLGALAAYGGILLIEVLRQLNLLGNGLDSVSFNVPDEATLTYAVAFLLGLSEGLINRIADAGQNAVLAKADPSEVMPATSVSGKVDGRD